MLHSQKKLPNELKSEMSNMSKKQTKPMKVLEENTGEFIYNLETGKAFLSVFTIKKRLKILTISKSKTSLQQKAHKQNKKGNNRLEENI